MTRDKSNNPIPEDMQQVIRLRSRLGMVFQSFNLWAHMTVLENVAEALIHVLKMSKSEAREQAETRWGCMIERTTIRHTFPVGSSSEQRLHAHSRWNPK